MYENTNTCSRLDAYSAETMWPKDDDDDIQKQNLHAKYTI